MELTKDVNLSLDSFEEGKDFTINYYGALYKNGAENVYLNYGYGDNWENKEELKMNKGQGGYSLNITPKNYGAFNFCFRDNNNSWDNNSYKNYSIDVKKKQVIQKVTLEEKPQEEVKGFGGVQGDIQGEVKEEVKGPVQKAVVEEKAQGNGGVQGGIQGEVKEEAKGPVQKAVVEEKVQGIGGVQGGIQGEVKEEAKGSVQKIQESTERKTFNIDAIIEEILNTDIAPAPVQPIQYEEPKIEKIVAKENPSHINKTSLLVEDVLVPFYASEPVEGEGQDGNNQFLPVDPKTYSKFFTIKKKIKLAIYKILNAIPKLITGNYTKKKHSEN